MSVRSSASLLSPQITTLNKGTEIIITKVSGYWGQTDEGWVHLGYCCYLTEEDVKTALKEVKMAGCVENNKWCNPVIDITPDMKATSCFGAYNLVDIKDFECIEDV